MDFTTDYFQSSFNPVLSRDLEKMVLITRMNLVFVFHLLLLSDLECKPTHDADTLENYKPGNPSELMKTLIPANVTTPLLQALPRQLRAASAYFCCYDYNDYSRERRYEDRSRERSRYDDRSRERDPYDDRSRERSRYGDRSRKRGGYVVGSRERDPYNDRSRGQPRSRGGDYHETRSSSFSSQSRSDVHISYS